jgi:hypothetical protein
MIRNDPAKLTTTDSFKPSIVTPYAITDPKRSYNKKTALNKPPIENDITNNKKGLNTSNLFCFSIGILSTNKLAHRPIIMNIICILFCVFSKCVLCADSTHLWDGRNYIDPLMAEQDLVGSAELGGAQVQQSL